MLESVPDRHIYKLSIFQPTEPCAFFRIIKKEVSALVYLFSIIYLSLYIYLVNQFFFSYFR